MSRAIPSWLSHLRTDRRGLPVPYVNLWGPSDDVDKVSIRHDPWVGGPAVFMDDEGETLPDFTRQNMQRQRECVVNGLCQVCRRHIPWSRRHLVLASMSVDQIILAGRPAVVVTEPWLDDRCAAFAVESCPALIRRSRDEHLTLHPITSQRQVAMVMSTGYLDGPLEEESRRIQPAMWAKILIHNLRFEVRAA